jgi:hypothetical protein
VDVIQVVKRATSPSPGGRYQAVDGMLEDLARALRDRWSDVLRLEVGHLPSGPVPAVSAKAPADGAPDPGKATTRSQGSGQLLPSPFTERARPLRRGPLYGLASLVLLGVVAVIWFRARDPGPQPADPAARARPAAVRPEVQLPPPSPGASRRPASSPGAGPAPARARSPDAGARARLLSVSSTPPAAEVYVDGRPLGRTPLDGLRVSRAALRVELRKPGFQPATRRVQPGRAAVELQLRLRPLPASLSVVALHQGKTMEAAIHLDGRLVDHTPAVIGSLKPGRHRLKMVAEGFRTEERVVILEPGKRRVVMVGLVR